MKSRQGMQNKTAPPPAPLAQGLDPLLSITIVDHNRKFIFE